MTDALQRLWAPWRHQYVSRATRHAVGCIFCRAHRSRNDRKTQVVCRGRRAFVLLNRYPYNPGHLMVAPCRHLGRLERLSADEGQELFQLTQRMTHALTTLLHPHGMNVGMNLGRAAGAGIPGHLHLHIVPRWAGDTNFMPIIGRTKVLSSSLTELYRNLKALVDA